MRIAAQVAFAMFALVALGFCMAFALEEMLARATTADAAGRSAPAQAPRAAPRALAADSLPVAGDPLFADELFAAGASAAGFRLESALPEMDAAELEDRFVEFMSRDLEDARSVGFAGRILQELARRQPERAAALLYALTPAEKEKLVPSLARGWVAADEASAFAWIETAWIDPDGEYIDRELQNRLYIESVDTLAGLRDFDAAARRVEGVADPDLKRRLVDLLARRIVADGPELALDRMAASRDEVLDTAILEAISEEWSARDPIGAMEWALGNQEEVSPGAARAVAKQLAINQLRKPLIDFHDGFRDRATRDSVASEAARLLARREPVVSADWILAIEGSAAKFAAVQDALYEIGYERFSASVDYIDYVYRREEPERMPVLYSALKDWVLIDRASVQAYLQSERAGMDPALSGEILAQPQAL